MQTDENPLSLPEHFFTVSHLRQTVELLWQWTEKYVLSMHNLVQLVLLLLACIISMCASRFLLKLFSSIQHPFWQKHMGKNGLIVILTGPVILYVLLSTGSFFYTFTGEAFLPILKIAAQLAAVWIAIRIISRFIHNPFWSKTAAITAWSLAALNAFGFLDKCIYFLDLLAIHIGKTRLSVWIILKGLVILSALVFLARMLSRNIKNKIHKIPDLTPSLQILFGQILQVVLFTAAFFIGLTSLGIDLSFLAIFGGAIGLGVGFGLQSVIANFISGIILLLDRSLKPGDVISVEDTYGIVKALNLRYSEVITRDGIEHLIPNETFITQRVINWSHSDHKVRVKRSIGVSYQTDVRQAQKLAIEATKNVERVLKTPLPVCHLIGFGDNAINLQIRFWIRDPAKGINNISSAVLLAIWDIYKKNGIEFPFPQRDIHLKSDIPLTVKIPKEQ